MSEYLFAHLRNHESTFATFRCTLSLPVAVRRCDIYIQLYSPECTLAENINIYAMYFRGSVDKIAFAHDWPCRMDGWMDGARFNVPLDTE